MTWISKNYLANTVRMSRFRGSFLFVEGISDSKFFKKFLNTRRCRILYGKSKQIVLEALRILNQDESFNRQIKRYLALVDRDYDLILGREIHDPNLIYTDTRDLECLLIASPALEKLLTEHISANPALKNLNIFTKANGSVREAIIKIAEPIGLLRLYSVKMKKNLNFEDLNYLEFMQLDLSNFIIDTKTMLIQILRKKGVQQFSEITIRAEIETIKEEIPSDFQDPFQICSGHDLTNILAILLRELFNCSWIRSNFILEKELRLAYESAFFEQTDNYRILLNWESNNPPFVIVSN